MGNEETYLNFMRCLTLYTKDIVTGAELIDILQPFTLYDVSFVFCVILLCNFFISVCAENTNQL